MKKIISILLLSGLLLTCFSGCAVGLQTPEAKLNFSADPFIQAPALSWEYSLNIQSEDNGIYINDVLYKKTSPTASVVISYSEEFLSHAALLDKMNGNQEKSDTLIKIKNSECHCFLETDADGKAGKRILVYKIDNIYYFVRLFDDGEVMRIHRAIVEQEV